MGLKNFKNFQGCSSCGEGCCNTVNLIPPNTSIPASGSVTVNGLTVGNIYCLVYAAETGGITMTLTNGSQEFNFLSGGAPIYFHSTATSCVLTNGAMFVVPLTVSGSPVSYLAPPSTLCNFPVKAIYAFSDLSAGFDNFLGSFNDAITVVNDFDMATIPWGQAAASVYEISGAAVTTISEQNLFTLQSILLSSVVGVPNLFWVHSQAMLAMCSGLGYVFLLVRYQIRANELGGGAPFSLFTAGMEWKITSLRHTTFCADSTGRNDFGDSKIAYGGQVMNLPVPAAAAGFLSVITASAPWPSGPSFTYADYRLTTGSTC